LEGLGKGSVWNVTLVLVELAGHKQTAGRKEHFVQFVDYRGLADAGIAGHQHQLLGVVSVDPGTFARSFITIVESWVGTAVTHSPGGTGSRAMWQ
jgi:hypothetical protein